MVSAGSVWAAQAKLAMFGHEVTGGTVQVNILEAKNRLSQLIRAARAGEDVVIANRGEPVARLVPVTRRASGSGEARSARALLDWLESHPLPAYARRSAEEIDADIEQERRAWD